MDYSLPYYLGAPLWALNDWKGEFFTKRAKPSEFLQEYAQFFNAVEGNTSFYAVPSAAMVQRWAAATPLHFRFQFKLPRTITHEAKCQHCQAELSAFLQRMAPLGERLESFMIQLPARFSPDYLPVLRQFLSGLSTDYQYAVEVRHPDFFTQSDKRAALNALLAEYAIDRIIFDSRPVHAAPALDAATQEAHARKPRLPVQLDTTATKPILRYIGHPVLEENHTWLMPWVAQTARWIEAKKQPRVFLHTPSNRTVPLLALWFHQQLQQYLPPLANLPAFPNHKDQASLL